MTNSLNSHKLTVWLTTCISLLISLTGCSSTGEKISKQSTVAAIRDIGIVVQVRNGVEVVDATEDSALIGAILLGIVGDQIQQAARHERDKAAAHPMQAVLSVAGYKQQVLITLSQALQDSKKFRSVQSCERVEAAQSCEAVLVLDVEKWGVRPNPVASGKDRPMQVGHMVSYKLLQRPGGAVLWHRRQLFLSGKERTLAEYQNNADILKEDVRNSLERYCKLIVNQLIY